MSEQKKTGIVTANEDIVTTENLVWGVFMYRVWGWLERKENRK